MCCPRIEESFAGPPANKLLPPSGGFRPPAAIPKSAYVQTVALPPRDQPGILPTTPLQFAEPASAPPFWTRFVPPPPPLPPEVPIPVSPTVTVGCAGSLLAIVNVPVCGAVPAVVGEKRTVSV